MLIAIQHEQRVQAGDAVAGVDYLCPDSNCKGRVRLRKRTGYIAHFYHLGEARCPNEGESPEHEAAKVEIQSLYRSREVDAELEVYWSDVVGLQDAVPNAFVTDKIRAKDRRCDVLLTNNTRGAKSRFFAIEIQGVNLESAEFDGRIHDWGLLNIPVIWVALMKPSWLQKLSENKSAHRLEKITLRNFEHRMLRRSGHIWYFDPGKRSLRRGTVEPHQLYKNPKDYFDPNIGEMVSDEGCYYSSARWYDLVLEPQIPIEEIGLKRIVRKLKNGVETRIFDWCKLKN